MTRRTHRTRRPLLALARLPLALPALAALAGAGCTVGPDYVSPFETAPVETASSETPSSDAAMPEAATPEAATPQTQPLPDDAWSESWSADDAGDDPAQAADLDRWWQRLGDPTLDRLVDEALAASPRLAQATARVAEARALRDRTAGGARPAVGAAGSVTERRQSENGPLPIDRIPGLDRDQTIFDAGFDASWELDLAGGTRRAVEAADARVDGTVWELRGARLRLAAEVVRVYVGLREGQRRLAAVESQVAQVERTRDLVALRVEAGEDPRLDLERVEADLRRLRTRLPALRSELRASALALGVLQGQAPEAGLPLLRQDPAALDLTPFPRGARAELLRRRPDVRAAERRLAAATAEIGVATAALYPRLSLGARGGFQSLDGEPLFDSGSVTWSLMPAITWRILDGGRVHAEIRAAEARTEAAAHAFTSAVLEALGDAEQALARYRGGLDALQLARDAAQSARRVRDLETLRHEAGETPLLPLLDAQRRLDEAEAALADVRLDTAFQLVALTKALGGGWG